jgi:Mrp family chromosome partitioning ATPase
MRAFWGIIRRDGWLGRLLRPDARRTTDNRSFLRLATRIEFELTDGGVGHSLLLAAPRSARIVSHATLELGFCLAEDLGRRVLLVDATFCNSGIGAVLGLEKNPGLADLLGGADRLFESTIRATRHERIFILTSGNVAATDPATLRSANLEGLLRHATAVFDYVLIQGSPVLDDARSLILSPLVERILLIAEEGKTRLEDLEHSCRDLNACRAAAVNLVLVKPTHG